MRLIMLFSLFVISSCRFVHCKEKIHIGAFVSNFHEDKYSYKSAIQAAVQLINEDSTILPNHELSMHFLDNFGMVGFGINEFFKMQEKAPVLQVLLGPFTEKNAKPIRYLTSSLKLAQFEDSDELHHKRRKALLSIFKHFGWKRISLLYDFKYFQIIQATENLKKALDANGFSTLSVQGFSSGMLSNAFDQMRNLKEQDARIISVDIDRHAGQILFCDAYMNNMTSPKHIFVSGSVSLEDNWHKISTDRRCTPEQLEIASNGFISLARSNFRLDGMLSVAKQSKETIWELIKHYKRITWLDYHSNHYFWKHQPKSKLPVIREKDFYQGSTRIFDLVYRVALAFDGLLKEKDSSDILMLKYHDTERYKRIVNTLKNVEFEGITGRQYYSDVTGGGSERDYIVRQYKNGTFQKIGYFTSSSNTLTIFKDRQVFKDNHVPTDGVVIREYFLEYNLWLVYTMWGAATCGITLSGCFLFINTWYRKRRVLKMASSNINSCIIIGCILCYVAVVLYGMDTRYLNLTIVDSLCNVTIATLSIGFTLSFGGLFSKTWRVYRIFSAARHNKKMVLRDYHLYMIITALVFFDLVILISYLIAYPFILDDIPFDQKLDVKKDVLRVFIKRRCSCRQQLPFTLTLFSYKAIVLLFGLFMAWETRNVNIPILNDAKHIGMAVYAVTVISTVGTICASALNTTSHIAESYFVVGISICLCTTITLLFVFLPKVLLLFDKDGERKRRSVSSSSVSSTLGSPTMIQTQVVKTNHNTKTIPVLEDRQVALLKKNGKTKARSVSFKEACTQLS